MTLSDVFTPVTSWLFARDAGERINKELVAVRRKYIGVSAVEIMPLGQHVNCVITSIDWIPDYMTNGGWDVGVIYTSGILKGQMSHTSDKVLVDLGSK